MIETGRTIVYPHISLLTNIEIPGLHSKENIDHLQVPIDLSVSSKVYKFSSFDESYIKYDAYEEIYIDVIKHFNPTLNEYDFDVDTRYNRDNFDKEYILTTKSCSNVLKSFSRGPPPITTRGISVI